MKPGARRFCQQIKKFMLMQWACRCLGAGMGFKEKWAGRNHQTSVVRRLILTEVLGKCFLLLRSVTLAWLGLLGIVGLWIPEGSEGHFQLSFPVCHVSLLYYQPSNLGASPHATDHLRRTRGRLRGKDGYLTIHDCVQLCSDLTPHRKVNG